MHFIFLDEFICINNEKHVNKSEVKNGDQ